MNASITNSRSKGHVAGRRGTALHTVTGLLLLATVAMGADPDNKEKAAPEGDERDEIIASRYVSPEMRAEYISKITAVLSMNDRTHDPFGQNQDPDAKPPVVAPPTTGPRTIVKQTPFSDIINKIRVTTVIPAENRFLVGSRVFRKGDRFPVKFGVRNIQVEVLEVTANQINFHNTDSGEVASLNIGLMPQGMVQGANGISAPGFVPENSNTPLELDGNSGF